MEIIRNCSHYSQVIVGIEYLADRKPHYIVKTSFSKYGADDIINESLGLRWYIDRLGLDVASIMNLYQYSDQYAKLQIKYYQGKAANLYKPLWKNKGKIESAIRYHIKTFAQTEYSHGDYSIDNILFSDDQVIWVMDWEQFNNQLPQGTDLLYCIMEACFFVYRSQGCLSKDDILICNKFLGEIIQYYNLPEYIVYKPAQYLRNVYTKHREVFGRQLSKYPFVNCDMATIEQLDSYFER